MASSYIIKDSYKKVRHIHVQQSQTQAYKQIANQCEDVVIPGFFILGWL